MVGQKHYKEVIYHIIVFLGALIMIYPLLWMVLSSFKPTETVLPTAASLIPSTWTLENYIQGWKGFMGYTFGTFFLNSFIIALSSTFGTLMSSAFVAYALQRLKFKLRGLFFVLVLFAALTSSIALTESAVSTFEDELGWDRTRSTILIGCIMITLGSLSALGYGPLASVTVFGMQFLDFFDFLTNSVMMPIAAIATCLLVSRIVGVEKIEEEVTQEGQPFRRKPVFNFMLRYLCPIFAAIILASSVANALGWIAM